MMVGQRPNQKVGWKAACSLPLLGTHLVEKLSCSQQHNFISLMTKVSCLYYLIVEKQNCVSQPSRHQMAHLCCTQESRAAQSCTAAPQLLLGVRVQSALWKNPQAATASATLTDARDGGNISTSEEWPCAEATAQTPLWNRGALPEEVLTCASYILG